MGGLVARCLAVLLLQGPEVLWDRALAQADTKVPAIASVVGAGEAEHEQKHGCDVVERKEGESVSIVRRDSQVHEKGVDGGEVNGCEGGNDGFVLGSEGMTESREERQEDGSEGHEGGRQDGKEGTHALDRELDVSEGRSAQCSGPSIEDKKVVSEQTSDVEQAAGPGAGAGAGAEAEAGPTKVPEVKKLRGQPTPKMFITFFSPHLGLTGRLNENVGPKVIEWVSPKSLTASQMIMTDAVDGREPLLQHLSRPLLLQALAQFEDRVLYGGFWDYLVNPHSALVAQV